MNTTIIDVKGYELLDSRGNPTVCAKVTLQDGTVGSAISPSGASTGEYEAMELRDNDKNRYNGKGVLHAVQNINEKIAPLLLGFNACEQRAIDNIMLKGDATENKTEFGANAILAVSLAVCDAAAKSYNLPLYRYIGGINAYKLPIPLMNVLNGGAHAKNNVDIQEFMIVPVSCKRFEENLRICSEIYKTLGKILQETNKSTGVGDEGGFAPNLDDDEQAIELLCKAITDTGYSTDNVKISLDVAASEWYCGDGIYHMPKKNIDISRDGLIDLYTKWCDIYPIFSIEDGLSENDWAGWKKLTQTLGNRVKLVGDDLFVTNSKKLKKGFNEKAGNTILIKPNQIGTLTETLDVIRMAQKNNYSVIVSHRSGETEDSFIADLAVGVNAGFIKSGAPCRSDRVAKYNRLLLIEKEL